MLYTGPCWLSILNTVVCILSIPNSQFIPPPHPSYCLSNHPRLSNFCFVSFKGLCSIFMEYTLRTSLSIIVKTDKTDPFIASMETLEKEGFKELGDGLGKVL